MRVLGIETSCDETAAAVVELDDIAVGATLVSNVVASSMDLQTQYGGVVPEIAARSHIEAIIPVISMALANAHCGWDAIDAIAVTYGAGLGGSLLIGVLTARTLAITYDKPLYAINHVAAHVYANFITKIATVPTSETDAPHDSALNLISPALANYSARKAVPTFPMLAIIVSGGHSQLALFHDHYDYTLLGQTQDDAIGEAFDKVAKITGLPYPGGPSIAKAAINGNDHAFSLPKAKMTDVNAELQALRSQKTKTSKNLEPRTKNPFPSYDFSFSGLKTAVLRQAQAMVGADYTLPSKDLPSRLNEAQKADIAATFQRIAIETIVDKALQAYEEFSPASVVIAGGVAASSELRKQLTARLPSPVNSDAANQASLEFPDLKLCTDNGAMVATLGAYAALLNQSVADPYTLDIAPNLSM